ncbi:hypothetical protein NVP1239O_29 [Vibrio phage 1.239.O._10N.261.52.F6]|nr:hypothetical protein NVP1239O_29 [Vibrio phage 1.239.O._10N.261.52.F6]
MEEFTKGEWVIDIYSGNGQVDVISGCGRKTLHCNKRHFGQSLTDEDLANAYLIAAAPEMYEMLTTIESMLNGMVGEHHYDGNLHREIESLLEKARGESEAN